MKFKISIPTLYSETREKETLFQKEVTAIHSGKLGDIIYSLPTCQTLGINHLILNVFLPANDPLRVMTYKAAKQLVPLLLEQPYIRRVSITECDIPLEQAWNKIDGIDYNLDGYRNVARHRVHPVLNDDPYIAKYSTDRTPVHLTQMFSASQGIQTTNQESWLDAPKSAKTHNMILVSLTQRWRSFPTWYWENLLKGLSDVAFIGTPSDALPDSFKEFKTIEARDHLELASLIKGCKLFLGTVSFPYAIAEALQVNRLVELCESNLNAFPLSTNGTHLPPSIIQGRKLLAKELKLFQNTPYCRLTRKLERSPTLQFRRSQFATQRFFEDLNPLEPLRKTVRLARLIHSRA